MRKLYQNRYLHIRFEEKVDIEDEKVDIESKKVDIHSLKVTSKMKINIDWINFQICFCSQSL